MFKWSVLIYTTNVSDGVSASVELKDTKKDAEDTYYDKLSKVGGNASTKYLRVELRNANGELEMYSIRDNAQYIKSTTESKKEV